MQHTFFKFCLLNKVLLCILTMESPNLPAFDLPSGGGGRSWPRGQEVTERALAPQQEQTFEKRWRKAHHIQTYLQFQTLMLFILVILNKCNFIGCSSINSIITLPSLLSAQLKHKYFTSQCSYSIKVLGYYVNTSFKSVVAELQSAPLRFVSTAAFWEHCGQGWGTSCQQYLN